MNKSNGLLIDTKCSALEPQIAPATPNPKYVDTQDENKVRGNWSGKLDFILSCLSYAVGLGNVWRFPYQCYKNGGGAFVLPFVLMVMVMGVPLFFIESAFGQYASSGVISIWKACPLFQGVGLAMFVVSFLVSIYYNVIIAWTFFYLFSSFAKRLPWETCDNPWNTPACRVPNLINYTNDNASYLHIIVNGSAVTNAAYNTANENITTRSPSDEYFHKYVLEITSGFSEAGSMRWELVLCLLLTWILVFFCMVKGIKSSGRAVYFTSTFPYLVLFILLVRGLTLPGSFQGILYFITPKWEKLLEGKVWGDAAIQIFFSLAPGWGGLITLSSYNKFKNNCLRDAWIVSIGDCITSLFAGLVIFCILGFMAHEQMKDIDKVVTEGPGLTFIAYPEVVTRLPIAQLWSILFFLMLITLGLGTQFAIVNTVHTTIIDLFPQHLRQGSRPTLVMAALCLFSFLLGLVCCTQGGIYMLTIMDNYSATYPVLCIALVEVVALSWVYGYDQLKADIKLMLGKHIGIQWKIMWKFTCPVILVAILVFMGMYFEPSRYEEYNFPWYADLTGLCLSLLSVICIPAVAVYKICSYPDKSLSVTQRISKLVRPTEDWGPGLFRNPQNNLSSGDLHVFKFAETNGKVPEQDELDGSDLENEQHQRLTEVTIETRPSTKL